MARKSIADILLAEGFVTREQLRVYCPEGSACDKVALTAMRTDKILSEEQIARVYALYAGLPFIASISDAMADTELLSKVPLAFLRSNGVIPVVIDGQITVVTANPTEFQPLDNINMLLGGGAVYGVSTSTAIIDAVNRYYPIEGAREMIEELEEEDRSLQDVSFADIEEKDILAMASEAPVIKLVNHILYQAVKREASDVHIEPFEKEVRIRYRIDGVMHQVMLPPKRLQGAIISRIKIMAHLDIAEKRLPQDGRIQIKIADRSIDIRVSVLPVAYGERVVMRILDRGKTFVSLSKLGMSERDYLLIKRSIEKPNGIIYVTGPTGSGKTSTLYSVLSELNRPETNIITVEDPVEYQMMGIGQVQVREKVGLTFAAALRSILRQDPDIIMIGETRDQETAQIAIQAALTGHLVLSTLHTNSASATITRLIDMGIEPFLIASSVMLAAAQRLVRALCPACKKAYKPTKELRRQLNIDDQEQVTFYEPVGCDACSGSGYRGRIAIFELMEVTDGIMTLIMERANTSVIEKRARAEGMTTLFEHGIQRVKQGVTSVEEVLAVAAMEYQHEDSAE